MLNKKGWRAGNAEGVEVRATQPQVCVLTYLGCGVVLATVENSGVCGGVNHIVAFISLFGTNNHAHVASLGGLNKWQCSSLDKAQGLGGSNHVGANAFEKLKNGENK